VFSQDILFLFFLVKIFSTCDLFISQGVTSLIIFHFYHVFRLCFSSVICYFRRCVCVC
jgi:hypothetical protein